MIKILKKAIKTTLILLIFSGPLFSQNVNLEQASSFAKKWAQSQNINAEISNIIGKIVDNDTVIYIVNFHESWLMISADMSLQPVIGFSFDSQYSENDEADAIKSLFRFYADVARENMRNGINYRAEWESILPDKLKSSNSSGGVEPLLPVTWNQTWPYNAYCPEDSEMPYGYNNHHNTSCGPTAFSQILRYWKHPLKGTGSHSYYYNSLGASASANFGATTYNWDNMPASLNYDDPESTYKDVANLMIHVAAAVDESWGNGASNREYSAAAVKYFGYSPTCRVLYRDDYSATVWHSIFRDDLNNGRPIMICANSAGSAEPWEGGTVNGHYFVCDGYYGNDYYHINWGWGGSGNGYFPLFSFGQFVFHNHALIGLEPNYDRKELGLSDPYTNDNNTVVLMHFDGNLNNESSLSDDPSQYGNISFEDNSSHDLGQCLYLDNSTQDNQSHLEIPDNDNLDLSGDWTIEMWFKPISFGNSWNEQFTLVSKPGNSGNADSNYSASIMPNNDYLERALLCSFYPTPDIERNTGIMRTEKGFLEANNWYHFSFIRNTSDKTMSLFIHDTSRKLIHYSSDSYHAERASNPRLNPNPLLIGAGYYSKTFFNGYIDELRISNVVREPKITETFITITEPNGGESWIPGNYKNIKWISENVNEIKIEYSTDNGVSWQTVVDNCSANRTGWSWRVPELQSSECLIKISDNSDSSVFDVSDQVFQIGADELKITEINSTDLSCFGDSNGTITISAAGGTSPLQYSIDNGSSWQSTDYFPGLSADSYLIKVKDANGTIATWASNPVTIDQPSEITINSVSKQNLSSTGANDGTITINASGGTGNLQFSINNGIDWQTSSSFTNLPVGGYNVKVKDENDCGKEYEYNPLIITATDNLTITSVEKTDVSICYDNNNGTISISASGGTTPYEFSIDNGNTWFTASNFNSKSGGSYFIKVKDSDNNIAAWSSNPLIISNPPEIIINSVVKQDVSGTGAVDGAIIINASGGTGVLKYSIDYGSSWHASGSFTNLGKGTYLVKILDSNECEKEYENNPVEIGESTSITIYDIQYTTDPGPDGTYPSLLANEEVEIQGVVTAAAYAGDDKNFFISSPAGGEWQGIYIYSADLTPSIGDLVQLSGLVKEYYGVTEIYFPHVVIISHDNSIPEPCAVATGNLLHPDHAEAFEGCLVSVENVSVSKSPDEMGQWYVNDGTGDCQIDDKICFNPRISVGSVYDRIIGVLDYDWSEYGIIPRSEADLTFSTSSIDEDQLSPYCLIYPNPASANIYIEMPLMGNLSIFRITGQKLLEKNDFQSGNIDISAYAKGIYFITFEAGELLVTRKLIIN